MTAIRCVIDLEASPEQAWERLWDVPALAACIPGCGDVEVLEERRRYRATIADRVGPFHIAIPLDVRVDAPSAERLAVSAAGRDSTLGSPVRIDFTLTVASGAGGGTRIALEGEARIGGKLATLGQGVLQRRTRVALEQFAANLTELFAARGDLPST